MNCVRAVISGIAEGFAIQMALFQQCGSICALIFARSVAVMWLPLALLVVTKPGEFKNPSGAEVPAPKPLMNAYSAYQLAALPNNLYKTSSPAAPRSATNWLDAMQFPSRSQALR